MKWKNRISARKRNSYLEKMEQDEQKKQANKIKIKLAVEKSIENELFNIFNEYDWFLSIERDNYNIQIAKSQWVRVWSSNFMKTFKWKLKKERWTIYVVFKDNWVQKKIKV